MNGIIITAHKFVNGFGKIRYRFVVNGKSKSLKCWTSSTAAIKAGKKEYGIK